MSPSLARHRLRAGLLLGWELPQNLLGALLYAALRLGRRAEPAAWEQARLFVNAPGVGVSLGLFVFWFDAPCRYFPRDSLMRRHEHGHTFQSRWLGPLYLPLVGLPSVARLLYATAYRELRGRRWLGYFDGYPERWADRLGGISPAERAAQMRADERDAATKHRA